MQTALSDPSAYTPTSDASSFATFRLHDGRRAGFCWDEKPRCVFGHRIEDDDAPPTEGITRCKHRVGRDAAPCGVRIYLSRVRFSTGEWAYFVVEITRSYVMKMKRENRPMLALERLSILACVLPGVEIDLAAGSPGLTATED